MGNDKRKSQSNYRKGVSNQTTKKTFNKKVKKDYVICKGEVIESYSNARFLVELDNGSKINAVLAGKLRQNYIQILTGDTVELEVSIYDLTQGRISRRL